jgi:quercetin dioxygenase-like cupin family protein
MTQRLFFPSWKEIVAFATDGIRPQILLETHNFIAVLAGLEAGQKIPAHRAPASAYHFLEGTGLMMVEGERFPVTAGATVVVPNGSCRAIEAKTRLALLGTQAEKPSSR